MYIMIKFYLPGAFELPQFNMLVFRCMMNNPEWFYDGTNVDQVYGSCPNMLWNSGRVVYDLFMPIDIAKRYIETYNSIGVGVRFTFTNSELEEKHLGDTYCNMICEYIENTELNSVLVSSPLLEEYLRKTYPNLRIASSITKGLKTKESIIEETKRENYDCMVLPTQFNKDFEWLETIENKDKVEILLNVHCEPSCPKKSAHYKKLGQIMCNCGSGFLTTNPFPCTGYDSNFYTTTYREDVKMMISMISGADIVNGNITDYEEQLVIASPISYVDENTVPTIICHGTADELVPYSNATNLFKLLCEYGVECELITFEDSGHGLESDPEASEYAERRFYEFVEKYLR